MHFGTEESGPQRQRWSGQEQSSSPSPVTDPQAEPARLQTVRLLDSKARVHVHVQQTQKVKADVGHPAPGVPPIYWKRLGCAVCQQTRSKHHGFAWPGGRVERCPALPFWRVTG